jgi:hypothetical protein
MKDIEETHPTISKYNLYEIKNNVNCDGFDYLLELVQKHTIDKAVLKEKLEECCLGMDFPIFRKDLIKILEKLGE